MPIQILMPALSPTMTEGSLLKWHVKEGDEVNSGDVLAEIETDKATMEIEAVEEGKIGKLLVAEGTEGVQVNATIAILLEEGEDASALDQAPTPTPASAPAAPAVTAAPTVIPTPRSAPAAAPVPAAMVAPLAGGARLLASPLAKRMAQQAGLDLSALRGSGPHGRIIKRDIEAALGDDAPAVSLVAPLAPAAPGVGAAKLAGPSAIQLADMLGMAYELQPNSNMRKTIARRLAESKQTVPHFYLTIDCQIDELLKVRKELNERAGGKDGGLKVSVNDFVIRAAAFALKQVPGANASWDEAGILLYSHADISVAVATPGGLITPIIKQAETKGLAEISTEMKDLAARARDGKLKPEEYQGGSFSISNLGMFGVKEFSAIINPPQGCILAVGAGEKRPVVRDGALAVATVMSCTLSVDHRVVDGALGAEFLAVFKKYIEYPPSMLL